MNTKNNQDKLCPIFVIETELYNIDSSSTINIKVPPLPPPPPTVTIALFITLQLFPNILIDVFLAKFINFKEQYLCQRLLKVCSTLFSFVQFNLYRQFTKLRENTHNFFLEPPVSNYKETSIINIRQKLSILTFLRRLTH